MQPRPRADELLATVAEVLERDIVPGLTGPAQHHARVAANIVAIVERELRLGPDAAEREHTVLNDLLGDEAAVGSSLVESRTLLAQLLREGLADDPERAAEVWPALMGVVRDDLAISKPGHDVWEGE
jgi:hypothetical protein